MANTISISVLGDVKDISRKLGNVDKQLSGFGKKVGGIGRLLTGAFAGLAVGALFTDVIKGGSDLNETIAKTEQVFGKSADSVKKFADTTAKSMGLSKSEALNAAGIFGNMFDQLGIGTEQSAKLSTGMITLAGDLAAFNNASTVEVSEAMSSAFRGEYDALQRYIPTINAAAVEKKALAMTGKESIKALTAEDKALAVNALMLEGQGKAKGAAARESDSYAAKQKQLAATIDNLKDRLGQALLPALTKVATFMTDTAMPAFERFLPTLQNIGSQVSGTIVPAFQNLVGWIQQNSAWLGPLAVAVAAMAAAFGLWSAALAIWSAITKVAAAAQVLLNIALSANPIGIIILAVIGLIAAIVYLWKTNEGFREVVTKVWNAIKSAVGSVIDWFKTDVPAAWNTVKAKTTAAWNAIKSFFTQVWKAIVLIATAQPRLIIAIVTGAWDKVKSATTAAWNAVKSGISKVWDGIKSGVKNGIDAVNSTVAGLRGKVIGIFSSAGTWLINAGKNVLRGLVSGITDMIGVVKSKLQTVTNLIPDWKGPADVDKVLLYDAGMLIMEGLINGIDKKKEALRKQLKSVTGIVSGTDVGMVGGGSIAAQFTGASVRGAQTGNQYSITVNALDPQSASRAVVDSIREYERMNGRLY